MGRRRPERLENLDLAGFHARLNQFIGEGPGKESARAFAARAGISRTGLQQVLNGGIPGLDMVMAAANAAGVTVQWLVTGQLPTAPGIDAGDFTLVPYLDVRASAGPGALVADVDGPPERFLAFREDWLRRIGVSPRHAEVLIAIGDSMEPTIRDGDVLLVDRSIDRVVTDGIYVVVYDGLVLLKRIQARRDRSLVLKSDNAAYDPEVVPPDELPSVTVAGRVRWFGRTI